MGWLFYQPRPFWPIHLTTLITLRWRLNQFQHSLREISFYDHNQLVEDWSLSFNRANFWEMFELRSAATPPLEMKQCSRRKNMGDTSYSILLSYYKEKHYKGSDKQRLIGTCFRLVYNPIFQKPHTVMEHKSKTEQASG